MRVEKLFKQLKREYWKIKILQGFLDSIILFQLSYLLLKIFEVSIPVNYPAYSVVAVFCLFFFVADSLYRSQGYSIEIYEQENPELAEILRTAHDNIDESSLPAEKLFDEVTDTARKISSESIIPNRAILAKVVTISFLGVATVVAGVTTIHNMDIENSVEDYTDNPENDSGDSVSRVEFGNSSEVQGEIDDFDYQSRDINFDYRSQEGQGFAPLGEQYQSELFLQSDSEEDINYQIARDYSLAIKDIEE